jgi:ABC-2 type transporter
MRELHYKPTALASNVMSLQYFAILYAMTGHMQAVSALFESKRLYQRDTSASLYSPLVYWLVQATVHLPLLIVSFTVYLNIAYFSMGLPLEFVSAAAIIIIAVYCIIHLITRKLFVHLYAHSYVYSVVSAAQLRFYIELSHIASCSTAVLLLLYLCCCYYRASISTFIC